MAKLFTGARHAQQYMTYRPTYPADVYTTILEYCKTAGNQQKQAIDIGCGSGQSTLPLAAHFSSVTGLDPSENQIQQALTAQKSMAIGPLKSKLRHVTYKVGDDTELVDLPANSVDLITCAQSMHWLQIDRFHAEVGRVLRPGGVLAAYGYGNVKLDVNPANEIIWDFYKNTIGAYWDTRRAHIDNLLAAFDPFPMDDFKRVETINIVKEMSMAAFIGYIGTWSGYQTYMKEHPEATILQNLQDRLCGIYPAADNTNDVIVTATWPVFILLGTQSAA